MKNPAASCRVSKSQKPLSFPDLIGESRKKKLDSLVEPENDTRKPCSKLQGINKLETKNIKVDSGRIIGRLMKLREEADYYPEAVFSLKDSSDALKMAKTFVKNIRKVVKFGK